LRPDYAANPFLYRPQLYQGAVAGLAALALVAWYLLLRRKLGPTALACGGLAWLVLLGVLTAWAAPGASHLFALPALGCAVGGLVAVLLRRRAVWPVLALTAGVVPAVVLLMPLGVGTFDAAGLAQGGAAAALLALFGLALLPVLELLLTPPGQPLGAGRGVAIPVVGFLLVLALTGTGLAVDQVDAAHPRRTDLAYLLDADTGRASWVSQDADPAGWTRRYVQDRSDGPAGLADGPVWLGPAPVLPTPAPDVTLRSRRGDTVELHVSSPRSATAVVLRVEHRVDQVTVTAPGLAPATRTVEGTRPGRWPTEIRFGDLPAEGIDVTLRVTPGGPDPLRIACYDRTYGLVGIPGFVPRPPGLEQPPGRDSDAVVVARSYEF
ncbi:MAG: aminopeptidase, partial [Pseudonocardiaceae bacterium]